MLTSPYLLAVVALVVGYLFGSIPFGMILTRLTGAGDLRAIGSGNIGATNVLRTGRKGLAALTLIGDMLKGTVAVIVAAAWWPRRREVAGLGAFLGHLFPVWLGFKAARASRPIRRAARAVLAAALAFCGVGCGRLAHRYSSAAALVASVLKRRRSGSTAYRAGAVVRGALRAVVDHASRQYRRLIDRTRANRTESVQPPPRGHDLRLYSGHGCAMLARGCGRLDHHVTIERGHAAERASAHRLAAPDPQRQCRARTFRSLVNHFAAPKPPSPPARPRRRGGATRTGRICTTAEAERELERGRAIGVTMVAPASAAIRPRLASPKTRRRCSRARRDRGVGPADDRHRRFAATPPAPASSNRSAGA